MHREELKNSDFKQTQLASLQVELGKANSNKASFRQIDLHLRATLRWSAVIETLARGLYKFTLPT